MERRFGKLLTQYRERAGFEKKGLGEKIGRSRTYIGNLENYVHPPSKPVCEVLAEVLRLSEKERAEFLRQAAAERPHDPWYSAILETEKSELEKQLKSTALKVKTKQSQVRETGMNYLDKIFAPVPAESSDVNPGDHVLAEISHLENRPLDKPLVIYATFYLTEVPDEVMLVPIDRNPAPIVVQRKNVKLRRLTSKAQELF